MAGYSILRAEDMEEALELLQGRPRLGCAERWRKRGERIADVAGQEAPQDDRVGGCC